MRSFCADGLAMKIFLNIVVAATVVPCALQLCGNALANDFYDCTVAQVVSLQFPVRGENDTKEIENYLSDGMNTIIGSAMKSAGQRNADSIAKLYVGKTFQVRKDTGQIESDFGGSSGWASTNVLNPGNQDWSFKSITEGFPSEDGHRHYKYLEIMQYASGPDKPFVATGFIMGDGILLGKCVE
jgi:hypothetical protein